MKHFEVRSMDPSRMYCTVMNRMKHSNYLRAACLSNRQSFLIPRPSMLQNSVQFLSLGGSSAIPCILPGHSTTKGTLLLIYTIDS